MGSKASRYERISGDTREVYRWKSDDARRRRNAGTGRVENFRVKQEYKPVSKKFVCLMLCVFLIAAAFLFREIYGYYRLGGQMGSCDMETSRVSGKIDEYTTMIEACKDPNTLIAKAEEQLPDADLDGETAGPVYVSNRGNSKGLTAYAHD